MNVELLGEIVGLLTVIGVCLCIIAGAVMMWRQERRGDYPDWDD